MKKVSLLVAIFALGMFIFGTSNAFADNGPTIGSASSGVQEDYHVTLSNLPPVTITHSVDPLTITPGNSVACSNQASGYTTQNQYLRVFDLQNDFGINDPFTVSSVDFALESVTDDSPAGLQRRRRI